jgi:UDP-glucose 4-epimerase
MMRVLLTGAGGYIGSRLAADLAGRPDIAVRALVRKPAAFVEADDHVVVDLLGDHDSIAEAFAGVDTVVHLAGPNEVVAAAEPERALTETVLVSERVADAAAAAGVRRIVYVSTIHAYGALMAEGAVLTEEQPAEPRSVYAIARLASEHLLEAAVDEGIEVCVFRLTNSVGAPAHPDVDRWSLVTNDLCRQAVTRGELRLHSSGVQWRDFVALADACRILTGCLAPGSLPSGTYNLASGHSHTIRDLAALVQEAMVAEGRPRPALYAPDPPARRPEPYHVSAARLRAAGWEPTVPLPEAVAETVRFCLQHQDRL